VCIIAKGEKVLDGTVSGVKRAHGGRNVALALDGADPSVTDMAALDATLADPRLVKRLDNQNRFFEIELADGASPRELLQRLVHAGASIERFELVQPSLHQIFLEKVGATGVEEGMSGHG
jgi:ABC-2 type transport system ATP-binding protein